jgi:hypothetical protein
VGPELEQAGTLRKGYLSVVKAILSAVAGVPPEGSGGGGDSPLNPLRFLHDARVSKTQGHVKLNVWNGIPGWCCTGGCKSQPGWCCTGGC